MKSGGKTFSTDRESYLPQKTGNPFPFLRLIYQTLLEHTPGGVIGLSRSASLPFFRNASSPIPAALQQRVKALSFQGQMFDDHP